MNELIRKLAEEALRNNVIHDGVYRPSGYARVVSKAFADEFARLLVKECLDVLDQTDDLTSTSEEFSRTLAMNMIKRHFGIKND